MPLARYGDGVPARTTCRHGELDRPLSNFSTPRRPRQDHPDITTSRSNRQHISLVTGAGPTPNTSHSSSPKPTRTSKHDNHIVFSDRTISPIFSPDKLSFRRVRIGHSFLNIRAVPNGDRSILPFGFSWFEVRLVGGCEVLFDRRLMVRLEGWELEWVEEGLGGLYEGESFVMGIETVWDLRRKGRTMKGCDWQGAGSEELLRWLMMVTCTV